MAQAVIAAGSVSEEQLSASFNSVRIAGSLARSQFLISSSMSPGIIAVSTSAVGESIKVLMFSVTTTPICMAVFSSAGIPWNRDLISAQILDRKKKKHKKKKEKKKKKKKGLGLS